MQCPRREAIGPVSTETDGPRVSSKAYDYRAGKEDEREYDFYQNPNQLSRRKRCPCDQKSEHALGRKVDDATCTVTGNVRGCKKMAAYYYCSFSYPSGFGMLLVSKNRAVPV
jgi:hypothetical protein